MLHALQSKTFVTTFRTAKLPTNIQEELKEAQRQQQVGGSAGAEVEGKKHSMVRGRQHHNICSYRGLPMQTALATIMWRCSILLVAAWLIQWLVA